MTLARELELPFPLLQDPNGAWIRALGLWDPSRDVARPATLVVRGGKVTWAYVGRDKADRPSVDAVLEAVKASGPAAAPVTVPKAPVSAPVSAPVPPTSSASTAPTP